MTVKDLRKFHVYVYTFLKFIKRLKKHVTFGSLVLNGTCNKESDTQSLRLSPETSKVPPTLPVSTRISKTEQKEKY